MPEEAKLCNSPVETLKKRLNKGHIATRGPTSMPEEASASRPPKEISMHSARPLLIALSWRADVA
eukprot:1189517-Prorocentrum_minimum.AAC.1